MRRREAPRRDLLPGASARRIGGFDLARRGAARRGPRHGRARARRKATREGGEGEGRKKGKRRETEREGPESACLTAAWLAARLPLRLVFSLPFSFASFSLSLALPLAHFLRLSYSHAFSLALSFTGSSRLVTRDGADNGCRASAPSAKAATRPRIVQPGNTPFVHAENCRIVVQAPLCSLFFLSFFYSVRWTMKVTFRATNARDDSFLSLLLPPPPPSYLFHSLCLSLSF